MAALVADAAHVENLTEQFGRQRLDQDLSYNAESLRTQLGANNNVSEFLLSSQPSAWLICKRNPAKDTPEMDAGLASKARKVGRSLVCSDTKLNCTVPSALSPEPRVARCVGSKRNIKRSQCLKPSKEEEYNSCAANKEKSSVLRSEREESFDFSSSSDDELRDLFLCTTVQVKTEPRKDVQRGSNNSDMISTSPESFATQTDPVEKETSRKRYRTCRGRLKKKFKTSRPCLDLEKMLGRRMEETRSDKKPESIFLPIHQLWG